MYTLTFDEKDEIKKADICLTDWIFVCEQEVQ